MKITHVPGRTLARRAFVRFGALHRSALVAGALGAGMVSWLVASVASQAADPELTVLLRGMSVLKGFMAAAAFALVWWRFGRPVAMRAAGAYIVCVGVLFAATVLIWQLAFIAAAAVLFHAAGLVFLVLAWRESHEILPSGRPGLARQGTAGNRSWPGVNPSSGAEQEPRDAYSR